MYCPGKGLDLASVARLRGRFSESRGTYQRQLGHGIKERIRCELCTFPLNDACLEACRSLCFRRECQEEVNKRRRTQAYLEKLRAQEEAEVRTERDSMEKLMVRGLALDVHVLNAAAILQKLQSSQRPATLGKLESFLYRRKCCEVTFCVPPGRLAKKMEQVLESHDAPMEIRKLFSALNAATVGVPERIAGDIYGELKFVESRIEEAVRVQQQLSRLKAVAATRGLLTEANEYDALFREYDTFVKDLTSCLEAFDIEVLQPLANHCVQKLLRHPLPDHVVDPMSFITNWLCKNASVRVRTDMRLLVDAMEKGFCLSVDSSDSRRITYVEDMIGRRPVSWRSLGANEWISQLMSHEASANVLLDRLDGFAPITFDCPCNHVFFPVSELDKLQSLLDCRLDLDRNNKMVKISMPSRTLLPKRTIFKIVRLVLGHEPPLVCPGWFSSNAAGYIVGSGGQNLKRLEKRYMLRLLVQRDSEGMSTLVGWFSVDYFAESHLPLGACTESDYIQREVDRLSGKVSDELFLNGLPIEGVESSQFDLMLSDTLCSLYMIPSMQHTLLDCTTSLMKLLRCRLELDVYRGIVIVKMLDSTPFSREAVTEVVSLVLGREFMVELQCDNYDLYLEYALSAIQRVHKVRMHIDHIDDDGSMHIFCWMDLPRFISQEIVEDLTKKWLETCLHVQQDVRALSGKTQGAVHDALLGCLFSSECNDIKLSKGERKRARRQTASQQTFHKKDRRKKGNRTSLLLDSFLSKHPKKGLPLHRGLYRILASGKAGSCGYYGCSADA